MKVRPLADCHEISIKGQDKLVVRTLNISLGISVVDGVLVLKHNAFTARVLREELHLDKEGLELIVSKDYHEFKASSR